MIAAILTFILLAWQDSPAGPVRDWLAHRIEFPAEGMFHRLEFRPLQELRWIAVSVAVLGVCILLGKTLDFFKSKA